MKLWKCRFWLTFTQAVFGDCASHQRSYAYISIFGEEILYMKSYYSMCFKLILFKFQVSDSVSKGQIKFFLEVFVIIHKHLIFFSLFLNFNAKDRKLHDNKICGVPHTVSWWIAKMIKLNLLGRHSLDASWFIHFWLYLAPPSGNGLL